MQKRVFLLVSLFLLLGCSSPKKPNDSETDIPPPPERKLHIKGGAVELQIRDDEKIRAKPKEGGAFFEFIFDY